MHSAEEQPAVLLVSRDLMLSSQITGPAGQLGTNVDVEGDAARAASKVAEHPYRCVLLDLSHPELDVAGFMESLPGENRPAVVAFGPHVHTARLEAAREAGCDEVLSRGRFSASVAQILQKYGQSL